MSLRSVVLLSLLASVVVATGGATQQQPPEGLNYFQPEASGSGTLFGPSIFRILLAILLLVGFSGLTHFTGDAQSIQDSYEVLSTPTKAFPEELVKPPAHLETVVSSGPLSSPEPPTAPSKAAPPRLETEKQQPFRPASVESVVKEETSPVATVHVAVTSAPEPTTNATPKQMAQKLNFETAKPNTPKKLSSGQQKKPAKLQVRSAPAPAIPVSPAVDQVVLATPSPVPQQHAVVEAPVIQQPAAAPTAAVEEVQVASQVTLLPAKRRKINDPAWQAMVSKYLEHRRRNHVVVDPLTFEVFEGTKNARAEYKVLPATLTKLSPREPDMDATVASPPQSPPKLSATAKEFSFGDMPEAPSFASVANSDLEIPNKAPVETSAVPMTVMTPMGPVAMGPNTMMPMMQHPNLQQMHLLQMQQMQMEMAFLQQVIQQQQQLQQQQQQQQQQKQPHLEDPCLGGCAAASAFGGILAAGVAIGNSNDQAPSKKQGRKFANSPERKQVFIPAFKPVKPIDIMCKFAGRCSRADCQFTHPPHREVTDRNKNWTNGGRRQLQKSRLQNKMVS